eukprot:3227021-Prymnesium_polylepis.2
MASWRGDVPAAERCASEARCPFSTSHTTAYTGASPQRALVRHARPPAPPAHGRGSKGGPHGRAGRRRGRRATELDGAILATDPGPSGCTRARASRTHDVGARARPAAHHDRQPRRVERPAGEKVEHRAVSIGGRLDPLEECLERLVIVSCRCEALFPFHSFLVARDDRLDRLRKAGAVLRRRRPNDGGALRVAGGGSSRLAEP